MGWETWLQTLAPPKVCDLWHLSPLCTCSKWMNSLGIYHVLVARSTKGMSGTDWLLLCADGMNTDLLFHSEVSDQCPLNIPENLSRDLKVSWICTYYVIPSKVENARAVRCGCGQVSLPMDLQGTPVYGLAKTLMNIECEIGQCQRSL